MEKRNAVNLTLSSLYYLYNCIQSGGGPSQKDFV